MKVTQVVRRRLALLLSAVMILTSVPMSSMAFETKGDGWKFENLNVAFAADEVEVGSTVALEVSGTGVVAVATPSVATPSVATPSAASAQDAARKQLASLKVEDFEFAPTDTGKVALVKNTELSTEDKVVFDAKGVTAGKVTVTLKGTELSDTITVTKKEEPEPAKITEMELAPSNVSMKLGDTAKIVATAKFNRDGLFDTEKKEQLDQVNAEFTDENVVNLGWAKLDDGDGWVLIVTGVSVGTTSVKVTYKEKVMATGTITVEPKADPEEITMDLDKEEFQEEVSIDVALVGEGKLTTEQADAIWEKDGDWGENTKFEISKDGETEVAVLGDITFCYYRGEKLSFEVPVIGKAAGKATLTFTYKDLAPVIVPITVTGKVTEPEVKSEETTYASANGIDSGKAADKVAPNATEDERNAIIAQIDKIKNDLSQSVDFKITEAAENTLKAFAEDATVIEVKPTVQIKEMDLELNDDKEVIVKGLSTDLHIYVYIDGSNSDEAVQELKKNNVYFSVNVPVPESKVRGGLNYVQWTHYDDAAKTKPNNAVIADTVTAISSDNIATVSARAFSPFDLTFVANDDDTYIPSYNGHTSSSSTKKTTSTGQWKKAADGVRWWYEYSNGTWPANGWAQLVWNGKTDWYYFDAEGYMVTGWVTWEGNRYYLHPVSDNTQGHMYTGWQQIDGKWYYFRPESGGPQGSLFVNGTTPDGYKVDTNGVWIQ